MRRFSGRAALAAFIVASGTPLAATAQETIAAGEAPPLAAQEPAVPVAADNTGAPATKSRMIEEIIVTAQKREENIQDVPVSVSAFSAEKLDAAGIQTANDLPKLTPGLTITGSAGYSLIYLRGIGTSAFIPSFDPSVATYVDGLYIPSQQGTLTDLGGVERVEVLKGPQGTLFGRNSTGGAINVITKTPGATPELHLDARAGRFRDNAFQVYASYPLLDSLAISFAGIYEREDPYYKVVADPQSATAPPDYALMPDRKKGGRVKIHFQPFDSLEFVLAGYRILESGSRPFLEPNVAPSPFLGSIPGAAIHPAGDYKTNANVPPVSHSVNTTLYGSGRWQLPWLDIKALGGSERLNSYALTYDFDGGQPDLVAFTAQSTPTNLETAELQFVSNDKGFTPHWLKWIAGLYYLHEIAGYDPFVAYVGDTGFLPPALTNAAGIVPGNGPLGLSVHGVLQTHSYSAFAQFTVDFTDWFGVTLGGRYQKEDRFLVKSNVSAIVDNGTPMRILTFNEPKKNQKNFSPRISLNFRVIEDTLLYASFARSFKSGSYNIVTLYAPPDYVQPEKNTTFEIGAKTTWVPGLTFNAALFSNEIKNLQETVLALQAGGAIRAENAGSAQSRGAEFDAVWTPLRHWDPGFVVAGGATYLHAIYTDYPNASGFNERTGLLFHNGDFTGHRIARTPKFTGTLNLSQTVDTGVGPVEIGGDVYYNSGVNFAPQNAKSTEQKAYKVFDARLSYLYEPWNVRLTAFGRNLNNEKYSATSLVVDFGTYRQLAPPRTYGLELTYDY